MDRQPQRSTPPSSGQMPPGAPPSSGQMRQGVPPQPPIQPGAQPQHSPHTLRRIPAVRGLTAGEQKNPSPLVASVIAHHEQALRRHTSGLEGYAPQKKQQENAPRSSQPFLVALLSWLQRLIQGLYRKRVPVLLQMSEVECGAACLAMILRYYGRKTGISEVSERAGVGRDGMSALGIVKAARDYGLRVRAVSLKDNDLRFVTLPAIVHWQFNHFLIVERWSPTSVDVVDPASGFKRMPGEEFDAGFTGVVIMLEPGVQFVRHTNTPEITLGTYAVEYIKRAPATLFQIITASLLLQLFGLIFPFLTELVVNQIIPNKVSDVLLPLGAGIIIIVLAQLITMLLRAALLVYLQTRIDTRIMPAFFEHLLMLPPSFFQKRSSGDILTRIESNTIVRDIISNQLVSTFLDGGLVIFYLIILFTQSYAFGILVVIVALFQVAVLLFTNKPMRDLNRRELEAAGKTQGYVAEALAGITTLKASGAEQRAFARWSNLFFDQLNTTVRQNYLSSTISSFLMTLSTLAPLVLLWVGTIQVINNTMSIGAMLALNALATAFLTPVASLVSSGQQLQIVHSHLERIADVLGAQPEQDVQRVQEPPHLTGRISLEHVSFRYDANSPYVLKDISLHIEPGQKIAIVGRTGSGKSTLGQLLLGLCIPTEGEILYDGIPLRFLNYQAVRAQFGVVMQNSAVFSGSIRENIAFNVPDIGLERITRAAQIAAVHDDIMQMPMGYETFVSEGGSALSGGQRQRIAIARAVAAAPAIMLFDEATSALDVITEQKVEQNLRKLGCTQIIIAHRLSTVRNADRILVIEEGMLLEQGTHDQLIKQNRYYANLIRSQLSSGEIKGD
jgi:ATP-binding cassette subfamily B protein